jgi:dipeptidyl aminopeptidase/acylaminoacyl peptidase
MKGIGLFSSLIEFQLTTESKGHYIHTGDAFSPDDTWLVYDTRNDDTHIGLTGSIEMVNIDTKETLELYNTENQTEFGPGVGAVTFNSERNQVLFIHGLQNCDQAKPYSFSRRTGVSIKIESPQELIYLDARDVKTPYTRGALRGGTHSHSWSPDGQWVSFTYNDDIMTNLSLKPNSLVKDLRMVGVMAPLGPLKVSQDATGENLNGEMFSVIVTEVLENPIYGSNQIDRAYGDGWVGISGYTKSNGQKQNRAVAFLGDTRDKNDKKLTELFIVNIPNDITKSTFEKPIEGMDQTRPYPPQGTEQRRLTFTSDRKYPGIFWSGNPVRSILDGSLLLFMMKDNNGIVQIYGVSPNGGEVKQLTDNVFSIDTTFDISSNGRYLAYGISENIVITDILKDETVTIKSRKAEEKSGLRGIQWSNNGKILAYNRKILEKDSSYFQVFVLK